MSNKNFNKQAKPYSSNGSKPENNFQDKNMNGTQAVSEDKTLRKLFEEGLKDMYSAEKQMIAALPEMAKAAHNEELQDAFNNHLEETKKQAERLEKLFVRLQIEKTNDVKCEAMEGLIKENKKVISEWPESPVRDAALIIGAQKAEHYEIASYGSLVELAEVLGFQKIADVLDRSQQEEESADLHLTDLAKEVNDEAMEVSGDKVEVEQ